MKIGVLEREQSPADSPKHYIPRKLADKFCAECFAIRLSKGLIWIRSNLSYPALKALVRQTLPVIRSTYIPEKMPRRELPNCKFIAPQSDAWRIAQSQVNVPRFHALPRWRFVSE